jgi:predicted ATP-grasp superfamily ATP-dependent carboligase
MIPAEPRTTLLIVGASARAAAQSAARGRFVVTCADLFADADTQRCAAARQVRRYPGELPAIAAESRAALAMYTGGLENHASIVDAIGRACTLVGNRGPVLRRVRDPVRLHHALRDAGCATPDTRRRPPAGDACGDWLRKPIRSSGGAHVGRQAIATADPGNPWYYQRFVPGVAHAGSYLATPAACYLLGVTRQLTGCHWLGAREFLYSGSVGPLPLPAEERAEWLRIGQCLARRFRLRGLFGVDGVLHQQTVWTLEVNPRYTASMELIERHLGVSLVDWHVRACQGQLAPPRLEPRAPPAVLYGKAIVYARRECLVSPELTKWILSRGGNGTWPVFADIPRPGVVIPAGRPAVTVLAGGRDPADVLRSLQLRVASLQDRLGGT